MKEQQKQVRDWMQKFGQETPEGGPVVPSLEVRKLRAKLILEEALETIEALGLVLQCEGYIPAWNTVKISATQFIPKTKSPPSLENIADGIADSLVVQLGTAIACGIDIAPVFEEVMRSNEEKLWTPRECSIFMSDNNLTYSNFKPGVGEDWSNGYKVTIVADYNIGNLDTKKCVLVKDSTGKVIKPPSWKPPEIGKILEGQKQN